MAWREGSLSGYVPQLKRPHERPFYPFTPTQDADGTQRDTIENMIDGINIRVTGLAVTPDLTRIVTLGFRSLPPSLPVPQAETPQPRTQPGSAEASVPITSVVAAAAAAASSASSRTSEAYMTVYDFATRQLE